MRRSSEFTTVLRSGRRASRRTVVVHLGSQALPKEPRHHGAVEEHEEHVPARVGLIVSKAVGGSVVRSRVKRRLREIMHPQLDDLAGDVVLRALPTAGQASFEQLSTDVNSALAKLARKSANRSEL